MIDCSARLPFKASSAELKAADHVCGYRASLTVQNLGFQLPGFQHPFMS